MLKLIPLACLVILLQVSAQTASVPSEVEQYINANNFIAALSTSQERNVLARYDDPEDVMEDTGSERLKEVLDYAHQIKALEIDVDQDIIIPMYQWNRLKSPSGMLEIKSVQAVEDSRILIEVFVYRLQQDAILKFIAAYEEGNDLPEPEDLLNPDLVPQLKVQEWIKTDGIWRKKKHDIIYLWP